MRVIDVAIIVAIVAFVVAGFFAFFDFGVDRSPQLQPVPSQVAIATIIDVDLSLDLGNGIDFLTVDPPVVDEAADNNADDLVVPGGTSLWVVRHPETTIDIEVCLSARGDLSTGVFNIPLVGETYHWDSTDQVGFSGQLAPTSTSLLVSPPGVSVLVSDTMTGAVDDFTYYRFWLDVTRSDQEAGIYTNTVDFSAVEAAAGANCPVIVP